MATERITLYTKDGFKYFLIACGTLSMAGFLYLLYHLQLVLEFAGTPGTILAIYYISGLIISICLIVYALKHRIVFDHDGIHKIGFTGSKKFIPYKDLHEIRISRKFRTFIADWFLKSKKSLLIDYRYENSDEVYQFLLTLDYEYLVYLDQQRLAPDPSGN